MNDGTVLRSGDEFELVHHGSHEEDPSATLRIGVRLGSSLELVIEGLAGGIDQADVALLLVHRDGHLVFLFGALDVAEDVRAGLRDGKLDLGDAVFTDAQHEQGIAAYMPYDRDAGFVARQAKSETAFHVTPFPTGRPAQTDGTDRLVKPRGSSGMPSGRVLCRLHRHHDG